MFIYEKQNTCVQKWIRLIQKMAISGQRFRTALFIAGIGLGSFLGFNRSKCHSTLGEKTTYQIHFDQLKDTKLSDSKNTLLVYLKPLLIGVISSQDHPQTKLEVALDSWIPTIQGDIKVFSEESLNVSLHAEIEFVKHLPKNPKNKGRDKSNSFDWKSLTALRYFSDLHADDYEWFLITDDTTYIDGSKLGYLLNSIDTSKACYMGNVEENKSHKLSENSHLLVINRNGLLALKRQSKACFSGKVTMVDCIKQHIGNLCIEFRKINNIFLVLGEKSTDVLSTSKIIPEVASVHPLSRNYSMIELHRLFNAERIRTMKHLETIYEKEMKNLDKILQNKLKIPHQKLFDVHIRNPKDFWTFFNTSGFFSHEEVEPHEFFLKRVRNKEKVVEGYIRRIDHKYKYRFQKFNTWPTVRHGYYVLNPLKGVAYMLNLHVKTKKKLSTKQFSLRHEFSKLLCSEDEANAKDTIRINFIVPVAGRHHILLKFLDRLENDILKEGEKISLTLVVTEVASHKGQYEQIKKLTADLTKKYPEQQFLAIRYRGRFQRAIALKKGAIKYNDESLLLFMDIDCSISRNTLYEIRTNTIKGKQVYFPIVFSQYNPRYTKLRGSVSLPPEFDPMFSYAKGYWRFKGFGMVAVYKSDFNMVGGLNTKIRGWGKEDIEFAERTLWYRKTLFRAPSLGLHHIFHSKNCRTDLSFEQYKACNTVKLHSEISKQLVTAMGYEWIQQNLTTRVPPGKLFLIR